MPHLTLELSANVLEPAPHTAALKLLAEALGEVGAFPVADLKCRAIVHADVLIGDGAPAAAMVHASLALLAGRDISVRQRLAQACMRALGEAFAASVAGRDCQLSVELREMDPSTYLKQR